MPRNVRQGFPRGPHHIGISIFVQASVNEPILSGSFALSELIRSATLYLLFHLTLQDLDLLP
jgi:hypothetical protein